MGFPLWAIFFAENRGGDGSGGLRLVHLRFSIGLIEPDQWIIPYNVICTFLTQFHVHISSFFPPLFQLLMSRPKKIDDKKAVDVNLDHKTKAVNVNDTRNKKKKSWFQGTDELT